VVEPRFLGVSRGNGSENGAAAQGGEGPLYIPPAKMFFFINDFKSIEKTLSRTKEWDGEGITASFHLKGGLWDAARYTRLWGTDETLGTFGTCCPLRAHRVGCTGPSRSPIPMHAAHCIRGGPRSPKGLPVIIWDAAMGLGDAFAFYAFPLPFPLEVDPVLREPARSGLSVCSLGSSCNFLENHIMQRPPPTSHPKGVLESC